MVLCNVFSCSPIHTNTTGLFTMQYTVHALYLLHLALLFLTIGDNVGLSVLPKDTLHGHAEDQTAMLPVGWQLPADPQMPMY